MAEVRLGLLSKDKKLTKIFPKPGTKAPIWKYFGIRNQIEKSSAVCRLCGLDIPTKGGTTSCINSHLKIHHPSKHDEIEKIKRKLQSLDAELASNSKCARTEFSYFTSEVTYENFDLDLDTLNEKTNLDGCVTTGKDNLPIDEVEKADVKEMLQKLCRNITLPDSSHFFQITLPDIYENLKKQIAQELKEAQFVAVTIDAMMGGDNDDYLNVTGCFITSKWNMQSRALQTLYVPNFWEKCSVSVVLEAVKEITNSWSIAGKVVATTKHTTFVSKENFFQKATFGCIGCAVNDVISEIINNNNIVKPARLAAEQLFFAFSYGKGKQALREAQICLELPTEQLRVESDSLCCSWYWSFTRILQQKPAIEKVLNQYRHFLPACAPSQKEYDIIEDVCTVLKPMVDIINESSNRREDIISTILPFLKQMEETLEQVGADSEVATHLKLFMQQELYDLILLSDEAKQFALKASFLDPRFKNFLRTDEQQQILRELSSETAEITNSSATSCAYDNDDTNDEAMLPLADPLVNLDENENNQNNFSTLIQQISNEIDNYLAEPVIDKAENPLEWWRERQVHFQHLAKLARKYLCCSTTCCARNSALKHSQWQPLPQGSFLLPDGANILTFLSRNL